MRLLRVEASNFLSYEDLDLDLAEGDEYALVGPVGAGKSALQNAILFSLYGDARGVSNRVERLIHDGATKMFVRTTWRHRDQEVIVTRERDADHGRTSLSFVVNGETLTRATIGETQVAIDKYIGLPMAAVLAGPVMVQGDSDALMGLDPAPRKELLVRILGLDRFETYLAAFRKTLADATAEEVACRNGLAALSPIIDREAEARADLEMALADREAAAAALEDAQARHGELTVEAALLAERRSRKEDLERLVKDVAGRIDRATRALALLDAEKVSYRDLASGPEPVVDESDVARLEARIDEVAREASEAGRLNGALVAAQNELAHLRERVEILPTVPCRGESGYADCRFLSDARDALQQIPDAQREIALLSDHLAAVSDAGPALDSLMAERRAARTAVAAAREARDQWRDARRWLDDYEARALIHRDAIAEARKAGNSASTRLAAIEYDADSAAAVDRALEKAATAVSVARVSLTASFERAARLLSLLDRISEAKATLVTETERLRALGERRETIEVLCRAFSRDGIPTLILEGILPTIEHAANRALDRMPGGFRIKLVTQQETKSGSSRETLDVVVLVGGRERSYHLLSGGEALRVDVALRLALSAVSGSHWATFWLDEPVGWQDRDGREGLLEVIGMLSGEFGLVIAATHDEAFGDRFPLRLQVAKEDGCSRVVVVS